MKELSYYQKNRHLWKKGGKYYKYKPKVSEGHFEVKYGLFVLSFN